MSYRDHFGDIGVLDKERLLRTLRMLDTSDWVEFISDMISGSTEPMHLLGCPKAGDFLTHATTVLSTTSAEVKDTISRAIERIIARVAPSPFPAEMTDHVEKCIKIAVQVEGAAPMGLLASLVHRADIPVHVRQLALSALADPKSPAGIDFWDSDNIRTTPQFAPVYLAAMAVRSPWNALKGISEYSVSPATQSELEYPLRMVLRHLQADDTEAPKRLSAFLLEAPTWLRGSVESVMRLSEFERFRSKETAIALVRKIEPKTHWRRFIEGVAATGKLEWVYLGYMEGKMFAPGEEIPRVVRALVNSWLAIVREAISSAGLKVPTYIDLTTRPMLALDKWIDDCLDGRVFVSEVQYGSVHRMQRADIVRIGTVNRYCILVPSDQVNDFLRFAGCEEAQRLSEVPCDADPVATLRHVFDHCRAFGVELVLQSSSTLYDEIDDLNRRAMEEGTQLVSPLAVNSLRALTPVLYEQGGKRISVLDTLALGEFIGSDEFSVFYGEYEQPLPVGFFYPKGDAEYAQALCRAIEESLMHKRAWVEKFQVLMKRADIQLEGVVRPSSVDGADEDGGVALNG